MPSKTENILKAISAPLGFFVLALMVTETFLGVALTTSELDSKQEMTVILFGGGLFLFVVTIVTILVWWKAEHLTFDSAAHIATKNFKGESSPTTTLNSSTTIQLEPTTQPADA